MAIEHADIPDAQLHEPKGAADASVNEVYHSDGNGSGIWTHTAGAFFGEMLIVGNTTGQSLTAAGDSTLNDDADYILLSQGWQAGEEQGVSYASDQLTISHNGTYMVNFWGTMQAPNNAVIGIKFAINSSAPFSLQKVKRKAGSASDVGSISAAGIVVDLAVNDTFSLFVASDTNGTVTFEDAGLIVQLIKDGDLA